jgi:uncharacterized membrane protein
MSALSFSQLKMVGARPIILFVGGSFVIATLPVILVWISNSVYPSTYQLFIVKEYWRGLVPIVGGWIGGSTSQLVLKELVDCPEALFLSVIVLDNVLVNLWTIGMFQAIKRSDQLNQWFGIKTAMPESKRDTFLTGGFSSRSAVVMFSGIFITVLAINFITDNFLMRVIILSIIGLMLGNFIPRWDHALVLKIGGWMILVIMAILGLRLDFAGISLPINFVIICIIWIIAHYLIMILIAWLLNVHMAWVPIASMANLGGISTAPAVTSAYNKDWMPHAILLAILSMVSGNAWGMITILLFEYF